MNEQSAYDLGYDRPSLPSRSMQWHHVVDLNAFRCGQMDRQNNAPRNTNYERGDYDPITGERHAPAVTE
jgi:hypothetical protein